MGWWLGSLVQRSDMSSRRHNHVLSREFQSMCLALRSAINTSKLPPKQAVRLSTISGREGER